MESSEHSTVRQGELISQTPTSATKLGRGRLRRLLLGMIGIGTIGLMLTGTTGCTMTGGACRALSNHHCVDDFMIGHRNRVMAEKAWHCQKHRFCNLKHSREFKQGFIDGFNSVAQGGDGCLPAVAPKQFWGWRYQSAQGQGAVNSWFEGYPMGVAAAESAGIAEWGNIRTVGGLAPNQQAGVPAAVPPVNPFYAGESSEMVDPNPIYQSQPVPAEPIADSDDEDVMEDDEDSDDFDFGSGDDAEMDSDASPSDADSDDFDFGSEDDSVFNGAPIFQDQASNASVHQVGDQPVQEMASEEFEDSLDNLFAEPVASPEAHVAELPAAIESQLSDQSESVNLTSPDSSVSDSSEDATVDSDALPFSFE